MEILASFFNMPLPKLQLCPGHNFTGHTGGPRGESEPQLKLKLKLNSLIKHTLTHGRVCINTHTHTPTRTEKATVTCNCISLARRFLPITSHVIICTTAAVYMCVSMWRWAGRNKSCFRIQIV